MYWLDTEKLTFFGPFSTVRQTVVKANSMSARTGDIIPYTAKRE